MEFFSRRV